MAVDAVAFEAPPLPPLPPLPPMAPLPPAPPLPPVAVALFNGAVIGCVLPALPVTNSP